MRDWREARLQWWLCITHLVAAFLLAAFLTTSFVAAKKHADAGWDAFRARPRRHRYYA